MDCHHRRNWSIGVLAALCGVALSGCGVTIGLLDRGMDKSEYTPASLELKPPQGPPKYQKGWMDGCESGLSSTNELVKPQFRSYTYTLDPMLSQDVMYYRVWQDAYDYCAFTMLTMMRFNNS